MPNYTPHIRLVAFFILLALPILGEAQGWQRVMGGAGDQRAFSSRVEPTGSIHTVGSAADTATGLTDWLMVTTDATGLSPLTRIWGDSAYEQSAVAILPDQNGGYWVWGNHFTYNAPTLWMFSTQFAGYRFDAQGMATDSFLYPLSPFPTYLYGAAAAENGMTLLYGQKYLPFGIDGLSPRIFFMLVDENGQAQWEQTLDINNACTASAGVQAPAGALYVGAWETALDGADYGDLIVFKVDSDGTPLDNTSLVRSGKQESAALLHHAADGQIKLVYTNYEGGSKVAIWALSESLDSLWDTEYDLPGTQIPHAALTTANGEILIVGEHIPEGSSSRDGFLLRAAANGALLGFRTYGGIKGDILWDIDPAPDGNGYILTGQTASFSPEGDLDAWLLRTDSTGAVWSGLLTGTVARDTLETCVIEPDEPALDAWLVTATGGAPTIQVYTLTDSTGRYSLNLDTGQWRLSVLPPSLYWAPCEDSVAVQLDMPNDTTHFDLPVQAAYECPLPYVDVTLPFLRRCFENQAFIHYFNYGTAPADALEIDLILDPWLSVVEADLPFIQTGDTLTFTIGHVPEGEGGQFGVRLLLDCDSTVLGQTHCLKAHIRPDSLCTEIQPEWDGANLEVYGYCAGDSVVLTIANTGGPMHESVGFVITEDQIIFRMEMLQLGAGQDTTFVLYPDGATVRIVTQQTQGHPLGNQPTLVIEGCGGQPFTTGVALQWPTDDGNPFSDTECRENVGSFDPNDKQGLPRGLGESGVVTGKDPIEYLIRFQNTGTDTAFRVEIRDTLSPHLDLATLRVGASSHPVQIKIEDQGVLRFIFDPIFLPDSTSDWAGSQGFVKYEITPKTGLIEGERIENRAGIYFDLNPPVMTNTTLHTIGQPLLLLETNPVDQPPPPAPVWPAFPNPAHSFIKIKIPPQAKEIGVDCTNALGKITLQPTGRIENGFLHISVENLPPGAYFLRLHDQRGVTVARSKFIKL